MLILDEGRIPCQANFVSVKDESMRELKATHGQSASELMSNCVAIDEHAFKALVCQTVLLSSSAQSKIKPMNKAAKIVSTGAKFKQPRGNN